MEHGQRTLEKETEWKWKERNSQIDANNSQQAVITLIEHQRKHCAMQDINDKSKIRLSMSQNIETVKVCQNSVCYAG